MSVHATAVYRWKNCWAFARIPRKMVNFENRQKCWFQQCPTSGDPWAAAGPSAPGSARVRAPPAGPPLLQEARCRGVRANPQDLLDPGDSGDFHNKSWGFAESPGFFASFEKSQIWNVFRKSSRILGSSWIPICRERKPQSRHTRAAQGPGSPPHAPHPPRRHR
jgi:hypothetical protein